MTKVASLYILYPSIVIMEDRILARLKKIEGQIRGVQKMYQQRRDCLEIAQQISAVRAGLEKVGLEILRGEAVRCTPTTRGKEKIKRLEKLVESYFKLT